MFLYICVRSVFIMFSPEMMKFLINYQKDDFKPKKEKCEIEFKDGDKGELAKVYITLMNK